MPPILIPLPPSPLFQGTGECLKGPLSTPEDHVLKRPLGRSLYSFASTAYSLRSLHGSIHGLAFFFPSWDWKFHDSRYTEMIAIVKPVGCDLLCMVEFLVADTRLYTLPCRSVGRSVRNIFEFRAVLALLHSAQLSVTGLPCIWPYFYFHLK